MMPKRPITATGSSPRRKQLGRAERLCACWPERVHADACDEAGPRAIGDEVCVSPRPEATKRAERGEVHREELGGPKLEREAWRGRGGGKVNQEDRRRSEQMKDDVNAAVSASAGAGPAAPSGMP